MRATKEHQTRMLAAALDLAAAGWAVFPLAGKVPAIRGGRGHLDATTDREQVAAFWDGSHRGAGIGAAVPDRLIVIDDDPRNGGDLDALQRRHGTLPVTLTVWSGRGDGGRHLYYLRPTGPLCSTRLPAGIDLKVGGRGYCVMPPSLHPVSGQPYRWDHHAVAHCPDWLAALLRPAQAVQRPTVRHGTAKFDGLVKTVAAQTEGNRNNALFWATLKALNDGADQGVLDALRDAALTNGLAEAEADRTIQSARRRVGGTA